MKTFTLILCLFSSLVFAKESPLAPGASLTSKVAFALDLCMTYNHEGTIKKCHESVKKVMFEKLSGMALVDAVCLYPNSPSPEIRHDYLQKVLGLLGGTEDGCVKVTMHMSKSHRIERSNCFYKKIKEIVAGFKSSPVELQCEEKLAACEEEKGDLTKAVSDIARRLSKDSSDAPKKSSSSPKAVVK